MTVAAGLARATVIGEFDSFHVGHRNLVSAARRLAARHRTSLSALVLHDREAAGQVTSIERRIEHLRSAGVDSVAVIDASRSDAEAAVARVIELAEIRFAVMACAATVSTDLKWPNLRTVLRRLSVELVEVQRSIDEQGAPITSDLVRRHLARGDVARVASLLGAPFMVSGIVRHGDERGRSIGFPTANLSHDSTTLWPAFGVYAGRVDVDGDQHIAAVNIGTRPTVYGAAGVPLLEAHLLDFSADLYDRQIDVHLVERIRGEQRFDSLAALTSQLATDVELTRSLVS